jgi:hypothetical protein
MAASKNNLALPGGPGHAEQSGAPPHHRHRRAQAHQAHRALAGIAQ